MQYDDDQTVGTARILDFRWQLHVLQKRKLEKQSEEEIVLGDYLTKEAISDYEPR